MLYDRFGPIKNKFTSLTSRRFYSDTASTIFQNASDNGEANASTFKFISRLKCLKNHKYFFMEFFGYPRTVIDHRKFISCFIFFTQDLNQALFFIIVFNG